MAYIYQRGSVFWYRVRLEGKEFRGSTKTANKKLAQHIANTVEADLVRKKFNLPVKNNYTFLTAWEQYIKSQTVSKETVEVRINASKHFLPVFKEKTVANITHSDIKDYQLKRKIEITAIPKNIDKRESEISFRIVNIEIGTLYNFFNFCIAKELIEKNPVAGIKKLNELSRLKTLSDSDIDKLIASATNKLTRDLITFLIYTGCRKGEALSLKWENVDLNNEVMAIKATKTKHDRHIPISGHIKTLLTGIAKIDGCDYVFNIDGKKIGNFRKSFMTACRNAGLKDLHIHDLRHVFASKMVMGGTSLYITGELLGHRTTQMTKRYSHLVPETLKKAVNDIFNGHNIEESPVKITKNTFVIADTHFGDSKKEKFLIDNWNSTVGKDDVILHLGDFVSEGKSAAVEENIKKYAGLLNGRIFLIRGNHDSAQAEVYEKAGIKVINEYPGGHAAAASASLSGVKILFSHYPVKDIDATFSDDDDIFGEATDYLSGIFDEKRYDINIHGHIHRKTGLFGNLINVSPVNTDYRPVKIKDVLKRFFENKKTRLTG
ncbi:MAG: tyrosine-type recombinase/integrase [bacterium]